MRTFGWEFLVNCSAVSTSTVTEMYMPASHLSHLTALWKSGAIQFYMNVEHV